MTERITILKPFNQGYGLEEWVKENLNLIKQKTGLKLIEESIICVHDGMLIKNEILDQTFLIKCDNRTSSEYDLGCLLVECGLQEPNGIIWIANCPHDDLKEAFKWLGKISNKDFETYFIEVETRHEPEEED